MAGPSLNDAYVLSERVSLVPVGDLSPEVRKQFTWEAGDCALNVDQSRRRTQILSKSSAMLLLNFLKPTPLVDAVISMSRLSKQSPESMMDEAWPFLESMIHAGVLHAGAEEPGPRASRLGVGDRVGAFEIVSVKQELEDFSVYRAVDPQRNAVALKMCGLDDTIALSILRREVTIGTMLGGIYNPRILTVFVHDGRLVLASEWLPGRRATVLPFGEAPWNDLGRRLAVCASILDAYVALHAKGVLHGDIHPGNIHVDESRVRILDFGASMVLGEATKIPRVGLAPFFEPAQASAMLAKSPSPPLTPLSEQFAIAAVLYYVLSGGEYYGEFSVEREPALRHLAEGRYLEDEARFAAKLPGVSTAVVAALRRALQLRPEDRFESLSAFRAAFSERAPRAARTEPAPVVPDTEGPSGELVAGAARFFSARSEEIWNGVFSKRPTASVNYGGAGVAYALLELSRATDDPRLLEAADLYAEHASALRRDEFAFYNPAEEITEKQVGRYALYHTATGVECVRAMVAAARGDLLTCREAVDEFIRLSEGFCESLDVTLGYSGILLGCALLLEDLRDVPTKRGDGLREAGARLREKIWSDPRFAPDQFIRRIKYLGVAHGVAGILYAVLRFSRAAGEPPPPDMVARLKKLADAGIRPSGSRSWPVLHGQDRYVDGWCNGTAGFVQLWCEAAETLGDASYLNLAAEASSQIDIRQNGPVQHLCCGTSGQGFAFLRLYTATGDKRWQAAARDCLPAAGDPARFFLGGEHSLYKGDIGLLSLAVGLLKPQSSGMPLFD